MATQVQFRRGTTSQNNNFTGAVGEISINTDTDSIRVHDGSTQGGFELARDNLSNTKNVGVLTATVFNGNVNSSGVSTFADGKVIVGGATTELIVNGNARITGILTIGTGSITINPTSDSITLGSGLTISSSGNGDFSGDVQVGGALTVTGAVTASSLSVSGNVSIAGTLTYQDVTNIDSVGLITARKGIQVLSDGIDAIGIITASSGFVGNLTGTASSTTNIPNLSGDITSVNKVTTLATVNSDVGTFGSGGAIPSITVNAKGLITGVTTTAVNPANDGILTLATSGTGLSGSATFTANDSDNVSFTVTSNATDANTSSTLVARDASGNFSAGTITASLSGTATTTTNIPNLSGDITSANTVTTLATVNANVGTFGDGGSIPSITVNAKGLITGVSTAAIVSGITVTDDTTTNATRYVTFTSATSGSISGEDVSSTKLTYNPSTGTLAATNVNSTSDQNLKENIKTIDNAVDTIQHIRGVEFTWKESKQESLGVIAQEIETVLPQLVTDNDYKSVNYNGLIGVLIEAVKEQQKQIESLSERIKVLES